MKAWVVFVGLFMPLSFAEQAAAQGQEVLRAVVSADSVTLVNEKMVENCAAGFAVAVLVNGNIVKVTERDTIDLKANCICEFSLSTVVRGLPAGQYVAEFEREYLVRYGYSGDYTRSIGSVAFTITDGVARPVSHKKWQSDCLSTSVWPVPQSPFLISATPNPFHESTMLTFDLESAAPVTIEVFDPLGRRVVGYDLGTLPPGTHRWPMLESAFPATGQYLCRVAAGERSAVTMLVKMR